MGESSEEVRAPVQGIVVDLPVGPGERVEAGGRVVVLEVMKMEHAIVAPRSSRVSRIAVAVGESVAEGDVLVVLDALGEEELASEPAVLGTEADVASALDGAGRADLAELFARRLYLTDDSPARRERVGRRHASGHRTIRENIADLCDDGSFEEWGGFAVAAQAARRDVQELIERTPGDGLVGGLATVGGHPVAVLGYDYLVLAGTQGARNHRKKDRLFEIVERLGIPVVLFAEGGGGRPGDTDVAVVAGLDTMAFALFARLATRVPTIGVVTGYCFAGNAALLGCCDVIIATEDSAIGMGGPAMIEGGGLGVVDPHEVGPTSIQTRNGVIDLLVDADADAVAAARTCIEIATSAGADVPSFECADQRRLRAVVPERRTVPYEVREVVSLLCDTGSVTELRPDYGVGIVTAFGRIEGRMVGILANNPKHLGGAIDSPAAGKAARHVQLCDAYGIPIVSLCDTPGFMVGPEAEKSAQVRWFAKMFLAAASISVPYVTVVLRKGYGLGAQAMAGGSFHASLLTISWPTGEFGGMGLEGAVKLAFRRELEEIEDDGERQALYDRLVAAMYARGKALSMAMHFEIDDVIDPAETRRRIVNVLRAAPSPAGRPTGLRPAVSPF